MSHPPIALVTGAAKRLGREIALALARAGFDIAVHYHTSQTEAEQLCQEIQALQRRAVALAADLNEPCAKDLFERCEQQLGRVTVLVNSASRFVFDSAQTMQRPGFTQHMLTNAVSPIELCRELANRTPQGQQAVAINLLDQKLFNPNPDFFSYTLSKACLQQATTLLAMSLAPKLRTVGIAPGITLPAQGQSDEAFAKASKLSPLGRSSTPQDVAQAVVFAATCSSITGTTLLVDGGQHLLALDRDFSFL